MTLAELFEHWAERDHLYTRRRDGGLTDGEYETIRVYRLSETKDLPEDDKRLAQMALSRWTPPMDVR